MQRSLRWLWRCEPHAGASLPRGRRPDNRIGFVVSCLYAALGHGSDGRLVERLQDNRHRMPLKLDQFVCWLDAIALSVPAN